MQQNNSSRTNYRKLNVSQIARQLVYGSRPRTPRDKLVTYKEMQDYVTRALAMAFGQYIHGLEYGRSKRKLSKIYNTTNGMNYNINAIPDSASLPLITEEKCTFSYRKTKDRVGEIQLQLEGFVCNNKLGLLKVRRLSSNEVIYHVIKLDESVATELIEKYLRQTLLPYIL